MEFNGGIEEFNDLSHAMKRIVLKSVFEDERSKRGVMKRIVGVEGVESVAVDVKEMKVTVIESPDPVLLTILLRKFGFTELLSVGPRPWRGIEEFSDLSNDMTVISHSSEEFNGGIEKFNAMKKIVLKSLPFEDEKSKRRVLKRIAGVEGVESVSLDVKDMKIALIESPDPVYLMVLLREFGSVEMLSVCPARKNKFRGSE